MLAGNLQETVLAQNDEQMNTADEMKYDDSQETMKIQNTMSEESMDNGSASAQMVLDNHNHDTYPGGVDRVPVREIRHPELSIRDTPRVRHQWVSRKQYFLLGLISSEFFYPCDQHEGCRRNECRFFCLQWPQEEKFKFAVLCKHCLDEDESVEMFFQIRRYMYQNVILLEDLNSMYDPSGIQAYTINGKRAVLLSPKIVPANALDSPSFPHVCESCLVPLRDDCTCCSLHCKLWSETEYKREASVHNTRLPSPLVMSDFVMVRAQISEPRPRMRSSTAAVSTDDHIHYPLIDRLKPNRLNISKDLNTKKRRKSSVPVRSPEF